MRSLVGCLLAGFFSAFATVCAWADGSSGSGNILVAPQLQVASDGPITASLVAVSPSATVVGVNGFFGYGVFAIRENPLDVYPLFGNKPFFHNPTTPALAAGTNVTFATEFAAFPEGPSGMPASTLVVSSTGGSKAAGAVFFEPPRSNVSFIVRFNAGVIETGQNRVLIGFTPSNSMPRGFGGFPVRISVSNVCVSGS